ncbi:MAG: hypothetical protein WC007_00830, partial [Pelobacteraceae bacterium]
MVQGRSAGIVVAMIAGLVSLLVYLRALGCDFVRMDDTEYVVENLIIRNFDRAFFDWAFTTAPLDLWMPLTWLSFAMEYHFWKLNPFGYHLTNIVLHAVNVGLVVLVADRVLKEQGGAGERGKWQYPAILLLAGLLWGLHPLRVESVAWVAERKDVLNGVFTLGSILAYLYYTEKHASGGRAWPVYLLSLGLFACSLMAKPVSVVLPLMLLVMDRYPLGRLNRNNARRIITEKLPFLLLSVIAALVTLKFGAENRLLVSADNLPILFRIVIAGNALLEYYRFMVVPVGILPLFVLPNPIPYIYAFKAFAGVTLTGVVLFYWRKQPAAVATWLLFILPLLLVSGLLQNGMQAFAARYTYLPAVPVSIAAAALVATLFRNSAEQGAYPVRRLLPAGIICLLLFYGGMTWHLTGMWKDTASFWSRIIDVAPESFPLARLNRGRFYYDSGRLEDAVKDLSVIIE